MELLLTMVAMQFGTALGNCIVDPAYMHNTVVKQILINLGNSLYRAVFILPRLSPPRSVYYTMFTEPYLFIYFIITTEEAALDS